MVNQFGFIEKEKDVIAILGAQFLIIPAHSQVTVLTELLQFPDDDLLLI